MADINRLIQALKNADAAGDTEAATAIAQAIRGTRQDSASQAEQPSGITSALRVPEMAARGFMDSAIGAIGAVPELVSGGMRAVGLPAPEPGFYPDTLREGFDAFGRALSTPVNRLLGVTDSNNVSTGSFGPSEPTGWLERAAYGGGHGVADVGAFMVPALAASKYFKGVTQAVGKTTLAQPGVQAFAGGTGGVVAGATDNPWLGLAAAIGTGVGASTMLNRIAIHGATTRAEKKVLALITQLGDGDAERGMAMATRQMKAQGKDTALVDVLGIGGEKAARAAANVPGGAGPKIADDFVAGRMAGRGLRLQTAANRIAPNNFHKEMGALNATRSANAAPLYDEAFAPISDKAGRVYAQWDQRLQNLLDDPIVKKGMAKGIRVQQLEALAADKPFNFQEYAVKGFDDAGGIVVEGTPNLRAMDAAKRGLDEIINGARSDVTGKVQWTEYLRAVDGVRRSLVSKLDDITTNEAGRSAYKEARAAYAGPSKLMDAAWRGRNFVKGDEEVTAAVIAGMNEGEKEASRLGARREISKIINADTQTALTKFADKKAGFWNKLRTLFPDEQSFNAFKADIENELKKGKVEGFVGPRAGAHSTPLKQDIEELGRPIPEKAMIGTEALGHLLNLQIGSAVKTVARPMVDALTRPSGDVAEGLARILLETSPKKQAGMMAQLLAKSKTPPPIDSDMMRALVGKAATVQQIGPGQRKKMQRALSGNKR